MNKILVILLIIGAVTYASGQQCGCQPQKLLKRSDKSLRIGDMQLDMQDIATIHGFKNHYASTKKWPNGIVQFSFANDFPRNKMDLVKQSLNELQRGLGDCIQFKEGRGGNFVEVHSWNQGCFSELGCIQNGPQPLNLQNPGCLTKGTVKHEFIHALGFMHTHMRKDRDQHISINWARIMSNQCSQFVKCQGCEPDGPYETTSVMHYHSEGFACDPREKVVLRRDGGSIGYNEETTPNDLQMIKNFYGCR